MRLDRLLFFLRLAKTRGAAQKWIGEAHMRLNGERVVRLDAPVAIGDVLTLPLPHGVKVIELTALPTRRGPAAEAQACYRSLDGNPAKAIGGALDPGDGSPEGTEVP